MNANPNPDDDSHNWAAAHPPTVAGETAPPPIAPPDNAVNPSAYHQVLEQQHAPLHHGAPSTYHEHEAAAALAPQPQPHTAPMVAVAYPPPPQRIMTATQQSMGIADYKVRISDALKLPVGTERDLALISALRGVSSELESAEMAHAETAKRVSGARELFDWATGVLSGYAKTKEPKCEELRKRGRKRKGEQSNKDAEEVDYAEKFGNPNGGPLLPPIVATSGGGLNEDQVVHHRNAFYTKLCGVSFIDLASYSPPANLVNLKSRNQLNEYIFIATHWATGTDTMDVMDFRREHKGFYTKMKISKENIGRRTGHHIRDLAGNDGRRVFCRYGKQDESLMYIALEDLYDAIFEIHCLTGHRGWQATKKISNFKYANIPQDQIRCFIDTCPICLAKKNGSGSASFTPKRQRITANDKLEVEEGFATHEQQL